MKCSLKSNLNFTVATANQIEISTKKVNRILIMYDTNTSVKN